MRLPLRTWAGWARSCRSASSVPVDLTPTDDWADFLLERRIEGGPLAAAQAAARLLKITFTVPGEDEGDAA